MLFWYILVTRNNLVVIFYKQISSNILPVQNTTLMNIDMSNNCFQHSSLLFFQVLIKRIIISWINIDLNPTTAFSNIA